MQSTYTRGTTYFELSNHLGNVLAVVTDRKLAVDDGGGGISFYTPDIVSATDYYPFGFAMEGRGFSSDNYRYGYQGSEKEKELKGEGNSYTTFFRQLDPRLGRWLSLDPKASSWESPYASMGNNPVIIIDIMGDTTMVYDSRGRYLETINDSKENQIHFVNRFSYGLQKARQQLGNFNEEWISYHIRANSKYYIGKNTMASLISVYSKSIAEGKERGGVLAYSKDDKELKVHDLSEFSESRTYNSIDMRGIGNASTRKGLNAIGVFHTHIPETQDAREPSPAWDNNLRDYSPVLPNNQGIRTTGDFSVAMGGNPVIVISRSHVYIYGTFIDMQGYGDKFTMRKDPANFGVSNDAIGPVLQNFIQKRSILFTP